MGHSLLVGELPFHIACWKEREKGGLREIQVEIPSICQAGKVEKVLWAWLHHQRVSERASYSSACSVLLFGIHPLTPSADGVGG